MGQAERTKKTKVKADIEQGGIEVGSRYATVSRDITVIKHKTLEKQHKETRFKRTERSSNRKNNKKLQPHPQDSPPC